MNPRDFTKGTTELISAWNNRGTDLADWIRRVANAFDESEATESFAAHILDTTLAEFVSVLRLGLLDDESLKLFSDADPPSTTWLLLAGLPPEQLERTLEGMAVYTNMTAFESAQRAIEDLIGKSAEAKVTSASPKNFNFASRKAERYAIWPKKSRNYGALKSFARRRLGGQPLTPKQAIYALNLLQELVDSKVIMVPSPDGDDAECQEIIDLIQ